jgi:hypothetical protein
MLEEAKTLLAEWNAANLAADVGDVRKHTAERPEIVKRIHDSLPADSEAAALIRWLYWWCWHHNTAKDWRGDMVAELLAEKHRAANDQRET